MFASSTFASQTTRKTHVVDLSGIVRSFTRYYWGVLLRHVLPSFATGITRFVGNSCKYVLVRDELYRACVAGERPVVAAFLHSRSMVLLHYMSKKENGKWIIMCSQSRDGDFMAQVEKNLGYIVVRGSTGKGGARALVEMVKLIRNDPSLQSCLAIDGSRGPRGIAQLGILTLVQKTNAVLLPIAGSVNRCHIWHRSWDRMVLPYPRSTVHIVFGEPIDVPPRLAGDELEALRANVERTVLDLHEEADKLAGFHDTEPLQVAGTDL